jgi:transposase
LVKEKSKRRTSLTKQGQKKRCKDTKEYRRSAKEGWLLASSLSGENFIKIKRVIKLYKRRMQIEEGIRDLKSSRYGFGLELANTKKMKRIEVLLLIAMLASFIAWLVGFIGEKNKLHYEYQANSTKTRRVLSFFYLGCRLLRRQVDITFEMLDNALLDVQRLAA